MQLTKTHLYNIIFWVVLLLFMGYKSINHTIKVHHEGVIEVIKDYNVQAQARINFLKSIKGTDNYKSPSLSQLRVILNETQRVANPFDYVRANDNLTIYLDKNSFRLKLTEKEFVSLKQFQMHMKSESLIYNSHARSFNQLIERFPYRLLSKEYPPIPLTIQDLAEGVIVER